MYRLCTEVLCRSICLLSEGPLAGPNRLQNSCIGLFNSPCIRNEHKHFGARFRFHVSPATFRRGRWPIPAHPNAKPQAENVPIGPTAASASADVEVFRNVDGRYVQTYFPKVAREITFTSLMCNMVELLLRSALDNCCRERVCCCVATKIVMTSLTSKKALR